MKLCNQIRTVRCTCTEKSAVNFDIADASQLHGYLIAKDPKGKPGILSPIIAHIKTLDLRRYHQPISKIHAFQWEVHVFQATLQY